MLLRISGNFNEMDRLGRVQLSTIGSLADIKKYEKHLKPGKIVIVYEPHAFEVQAVLDYDKEDGIWVASPVWSTVKRY